MAQIYLIDNLLGGEFSSYGFKVNSAEKLHYTTWNRIVSYRIVTLLQVLHFALLDDEERNDPMIKIFPKVTKCTFHNFGVSGSIQK